MAALVRILNAFFAALFLVGAVISLGFLAAALDGLGRGPEAIWRTSGGAVLMAALAILCFVNLRRARGRPGKALIAANLLALAVAAIGLVAGPQMLRWIGGVGALPFLATLGLSITARRRNPA